MRPKIFTALAGAVVVLGLVGCAGPGKSVVELERFPVDTLLDLATQTDVLIDKEITSDGGGSLRYTIGEPQTIPLFEVGDIDVEDARLIYQAKLRTENLEGGAYLEMLCHFPGKGEYFSRGIDSPLTGSTDWTAVETPFFLKKGENPDYVRLNLVIDGVGTLWIDDVRLMKAPLE